MRSVLRYLSPFIRSRRRISFLFTISILLSIAFILFIINNNQKIKDFSLKLIQKHEHKPSNNLTILSQKSTVSKVRKYINYFLCMNNIVFAL